MKHENFYIHIPYKMLKENIDAIREKRFNVEIYFDSAILDSNPFTEAKAFRQIFHEDGLKLSGHGVFLDLHIGSSDSKIRHISIQRYIESLQFCEFLGIQHVVFHHGFNPIYHTSIWEEWLKYSIESWHKIIEEAKMKGITIACENTLEKTPQLLLLLMSNINSKNFRVCLDVGHQNIRYELPLTEWVTQLKTFISELHIHDNSGDTDAHSPLGTGNIPFDYLFDEIKDMNIIFTLEQKKFGDVQISIDYLKKKGLWQNWR